MKTIIGVVFLTIVALGVSLYVRLGAFKPVEIRDQELGPYQLVYKKHVGAYHKIVPVIEEVEKWARANGEPCTLSFGEYLDAPDSKEEDRLESRGGCLVEKTWESGLPEGFVFETRPARRYLEAAFEGAPSLGPMKVYSKVEDQIEASGLKKSGPVIEIYEVLPEEKVRTRYLFPVEEKP